MRSNKRLAVTALMNRWARWRFTYRKCYGTTVLERLLSGMPGTKCPTCQGRGWTGVYPTCPTCSGVGKIKAKPMTERISDTACKACEVKDDYGNKRSVNGKRICTYEADFRYRDSRGTLHVEDTKGVRTALFLLKKKLMHACHGVNVEEVRK